MPSVTLVESAKLTQNMLVRGIIQNIIEVNPLFDDMPFLPIQSNALVFDRENTLGDVQETGIGGTITANNPATFTEITARLIRIVGDVEVDNLIESTRSDSGMSQTDTQITAKTKEMGRRYQTLMINGLGVSNQFPGMSLLCAPTQKVDTGVNGGAFSFDILDEMLSLVTAKDGTVDWIMMPRRTMNSFRRARRVLGGTTPDHIETSNGRNVMQYEGIPVYRNDFLPINQTKGTGSNQTTIYCGTWDDGSESNGLVGLTSMRDAGISLIQVGQMEGQDTTKWRLRWYCGMTLFNEKALACADGITD